jgi:hypothetical protein
MLVPRAVVPGYTSGGFASRVLVHFMSPARPFRKLTVSDPLRLRRRIVSRASAIEEAGRRTSTWSLAEGTAPASEESEPPLSKLSRFGASPFATFLFALLTHKDSKSLLSGLDLGSVL